jgi:hypothetical protein
MTLFERYSNLLQRKFSAEFDQVSESFNLFCSGQSLIDARVTDRNGGRQSTYDGSDSRRI